MSTAQTIDATALISQPCGITDREFQRIREMIFEEAGISLGDSKRALVCSRLAKRLRRLGLASHSDYLDYLESRDFDGTERQAMVNCLTTNKTDFFREPHHFDFLREVILPQFEQRARNGAPRRLRIWSAGCSNGHEPYTIAMVVREHFSSLQGWDLRILASDINTEVLKTAEQGVYPLEQIDPVPPDLKAKYFLRGNGRWEGHCQVRPELRRMIAFRQINLMEQPWPLQTHFDVIFCRNVIIYFNAQTQRELTLRFANQLAENGYLMLGHSEHPTWLADTLTPRGQTIYQRVGRHGRPTVVRTLAPPVQSPEPLVVPSKEIASGEFFASAQPVQIATLLGSCVSACLYDPDRRVGGMNHFLLPFHTTDPSVSARYGVHAMELLINQIMKLGGDRRRLRAKVFGGSSVLRFSGAHWNVGQRNSEFVRQFLHTERIPIVAERLGGDQPLRVYFLPHTGQALVKAVSSIDQLVDREQLSSRRAAEQILQPHPGDITLF